MKLASIFLMMDSFPVTHEQENPSKIPSIPSNRIVFIPDVRVGGRPLLGIKDKAKVKHFLSE